MTIAPLRILVVDDHVDNARMLEILLKSEGHLVRIEFDGPAAIEGARRETPDVVLLDLTLPGMSGIEVAAELRGLPELSGSMLIAVSGLGKEAVPAPSPFDYHIQKPLNPLDLLRLISGSSIQGASARLVVPPAVA